MVVGIKLMRNGYYTYNVAFISITVLLWPETL